MYSLGINQEDYNSDGEFIDKDSAYDSDENIKEDIITNSSITYCDFISRFNKFDAKCEDISLKTFENYNFCLNHYKVVLQYNGYVVEDLYINKGTDNFIYEDIFNIEIDKNIDHCNKYDNRLNMDLCLEEDINGVFICNNKIMSGEDLCQDHFDDQQSIIYENFDYDISDFIHIEKRVNKDNIYNSYHYVKDIINIEKKYFYNSLQIYVNNKYKLLLNRKINISKYKKKKKVKNNNIYKNEIYTLCCIDIDIFKENVINISENDRIQKIEEFINMERVDNNIRSKHAYNICRIFGCKFMTSKDFCNKHKIHDKDNFLNNK